MISVELLSRASARPLRHTGALRRACRCGERARFSRRLPDLLRSLRGQLAPARPLRVHRRGYA